MGARQISSLLAGLALTGVLASCGSSGTTTQAPKNDPQPTTRPAAPGELEVTRIGEATIDHEAWKRLGYRWAWAGYPKTATGASITELDAYEDRVITRDTATVVSVLNSSTGRMIWGTEMDRPETKVLGVVRDGDRLLVSTETELHEVAIESGNLLSRASFGKLINTEPVINGNLAIYGTIDGELFAMNRDNGLPRWRYTVGNSFEAKPILLNPYTMFGVTQDGTVATINLGGPSAVSMVEISGGLANNPVSDYLYTVVASLDRSVYCFVDGQRIWRYRTSEPLTVQPVIYQDRVYFSSPKLGVVCLDAASGEKIWEQPAMPNGWIVGVHDGELITWTGVVLATLDPENGDVIASAEFAGLNGVQTDRFENGSLYVVAGRGTVLRFDPR